MRRVAAVLAWFACAAALKTPMRSIVTAATRRDVVGLFAGAASLVAAAPADAASVGATVDKRLATLEQLLVEPTPFDRNRRSLPRPLLYGVEQLRPPVMQPYEFGAVDEVVKQLANNCDFVVLGARRDDVVDGFLAARLVEQLCRRTQRRVVVALAVPPLELAPHFVEFKASAGKEPDAAISALGNAMAGEIGVEAAQALSPVLEVAAARKLEVIPLGLGSDVIGRVQRSGDALGALTEAERATYLGDVGQFVDYAKEAPDFEMYVKRVVERRYDAVVPQAASADRDSGAPSKGAYYASFILADGAAAHLAKDYRRKQRDAPLVVVVAPEEHVKYELGLPGRLAAGGNVVSTVLLNPTPESTLSLNNQLRLELGVKKGAPVAADFVWFSEPPKPATLMHMMNSIDGRFKLDLGLSLGK